MVVADLDVVGVAVLEAETDSPLVVDGDGVLADSIALERMEPVTWRDPEELNLLSRVDRREFAQRTPRDVWGNSTRRAGHVEQLGLRVRKRLDHALSVPCHVTRVNPTMDDVSPSSNVSAARAIASERIVHHGRIRWKPWSMVGETMACACLQDFVQLVSIGAQLAATSTFVTLAA